MSHFPIFDETSPCINADNASNAPSGEYALVHVSGVGTLNIKQTKLSGSDDKQWVAKEDGKEFILAHGRDREEVLSRAKRILSTIKKSWK